MMEDTILLLKRGWIPRDESGEPADGLKPGKIIAAWRELRKAVGVIKAKTKAGVRFKVRSADEAVDRIRPEAERLGILILPTSARGKGFIVEDGTLAEQELTITVQSTEDGSFMELSGFGLGADNQDKAGGKAGTYAFKQALLQSLLAAGQDDTDDTDTPIPGGVKPKTAKAKPTQEAVEEALKAATTPPDYAKALALLKDASAETQVALRYVAKEAKERCGVEYK